MTQASPGYVDIGAMRKEYKGKAETFTEADLHHKEPMGQFKIWFDEALKASGIFEANAMILSTACKDGVPSGRPVLLKGFGADGFKFFTNYNSRKAKDLEENPRAALTFYWGPLQKVVRVEGTVKKVPEAESDEYFRTRPRESQLGALASDQSQVVAGRCVLTDRAKQLGEQYAENGNIPRPHNWGGYVVEPTSIEFWQGQSNRLHDRIRFRRPRPGEEPDGHLLHAGDAGWVYERLSP